MIKASQSPHIDGTLKELFSAPVDSKLVYPQGFLARATNPEDGFKPFLLNDGTMVRWIGDPKREIGGHVGERLSRVWHRAIGMTLVANVQQDMYGAIFHHSAYKNSWSPYGKGQSEDRLPWHGLGGIMAYTGVGLGLLETNLHLNALSLHSAGEMSLSQVADAQFLESLLRVAGKGMAMTPKWRFIEEALHEEGNENRVGLGGMKSIVIHHEGEDEKIQAIRMMGAAAHALGIYISGGDEGTSRGPWTNYFAEVAPANMAGASQAHPLLRGRVPNEYTAKGVYSGIQAVLELLPDLKGRPILFQGYGGVGRPVVSLAFRDGLTVGGVVEVSLNDLIQAKEDLKGKSLFIWDRSLAKHAENYSEMEGIALDHGFDIVDGLAQAIRVAGRSHAIGILSPNASSHPITLEVLDALHDTHARAVVGGANNMQTLDLAGSYQTVAKKALEYGIFIPNDSALNRGGATAVLWNALQLSDEKMARVYSSIALRVKEEYHNAFQNKISPQKYSDDFAQAAHDLMVDRGMAIGGHSHSNLERVNRMRARPQRGMLSVMESLRRGK